MENISIPHNIALLHKLSREISCSEKEGIACSLRKFNRSEEDYALEREKLVLGLREILTKKQRFALND